MPWSYHFDWSVYQQVPDGLAEVYLERLMMAREKPSRAYLDRLVDAHQRMIPFENLDTVLWNRPVSLEPDKLMEKILLKRRGGYCFELNGLFCILLSELGFRAALCPCRQLRHTEPCPVPATHCAILVFLDGLTTNLPRDQEGFFFVCRIDGCIYIVVYLHLNCVKFGSRSDAMELKLTLQRIEPYESFVSETWCPPELVPTVERMDKVFFESFLMDEFSEEVWDYFNTEFDDILSDMIGDISFAPKARYSSIPKSSTSFLRSDLLL